MARQVANQAGYAAGYNDPVRAVNPYTPTELVMDGTAPHVPIMGIVVLVAAVLVFEHLRRRKGR